MSHWGAGGKRGSPTPVPSSPPLTPGAGAAPLRCLGWGAHPLLPPHMGTLSLPAGGPQGPVFPLPSPCWPRGRRLQGRVNDPEPRSRAGLVLPTRGTATRTGITGTLRGQPQPWNPPLSCSIAHPASPEAPAPCRELILHRPPSEPPCAVPGCNPTSPQAGMRPDSPADSWPSGSLSPRSSCSFFLFFPPFKAGETGRGGPPQAGQAEAKSLPRAAPRLPGELRPRRGGPDPGTHLGGAARGRGERGPPDSPQFWGDHPQKASFVSAVPPRRAAS